MWKDLALKLLSSIMPMIINMVTPDLKALLLDAIERLEKKAAETDNPFDDVLVKALKSLFTDD